MAFARVWRRVAPVAFRELRASRRNNVAPTALSFGAGASATALTTQRCWMQSTLCEAATGHTAAPVPAIPALVEDLPSDVVLQNCTVRLYQFESCPFCRKARAALDHLKVPYTIVEVHPLSKEETKEIAPDYKKVPILAVVTPDGRHFQLRDSKTIVSALIRGGPVGAKVPPPSATSSTKVMWPSEAAEGTVADQWLRWTDKVLVQCIVLNVYRNLTESAETFSYLLTHRSFSWFASRSAAWSGTVVMWGVAKSRKRKYEIADERLALYEALDDFAHAVEAGGAPFMAGARPGSIDFNVYGIIRSAEGCQTERDILSNCICIRPWFDAMVEACGASAAINPDDVQRGS